MRELFSASLWPEGTRNPLLRIGRGLLIGALIAGLAVTALRVAVTVVAGQRGEALYDASIEALEVSMLTVFGFAFTFGVAGVAALWALGRRNPALWALTGGLLGAAAAFATGSGKPAGLAAGALLGWALFAIIRWQAGIRD